MDLNYLITCYGQSPERRRGHISSPLTWGRLLQCHLLAPAPLLSPPSLGVREPPFPNFSTPASESLSTPTLKEQGLIIFYCRDGETEAVNEGVVLGGLLSLKGLVSLTIASSAGTERDGLEIDTASAASGWRSHRMQGMV